MRGQHEGLRLHLSKLSGGNIESLILPGDHHFDDKFKDVAEAIWKKAFPSALSTPKEE